MSAGGQTDSRWFLTAGGPAALLPLFLLLPWGDGTMAAGNLLAVHLLLLVVFSLHLAGGRRCAGEGEAVTLSLAGLALAGVAAVGAARVVHQIDPYGGWLQLINYLFFGMFYCLHASACRRDTRWAPAAMHWLLAGILLAAGYGLWEQLLHQPGRVSGPFRDPNHLASLISAGTAVVLARLVFGARGQWRRRLWWTLPLIPLVWVLLLTGSRGGVLAFLALLTAALLTAALLARRLVLALVPLAVGAGLLLVPNPFRSYLISMASSDPYAMERIGIWRSALEMIGAHPLGVGLGNYRLFSPVYNFPVEHAVARFGRAPQQAHNMVLQLVAEGGLLMILPLVLLLAALLAALPAYRRRRGMVGDDPVAAGALLGLLGLGVQAMVSKNLGNTAICCTMLFFLAVLRDLWPTISLRAPRSPGLPVWARTALVWSLAAVVAWFAVWVPFHGDRLARGAALRLGDGDPAAAAALLHRASAVVPIQSYYHGRMAVLHGMQFRRTGDLGAFASAVRFYDQAILLNPRELSFRLERAGLFLHLSGSGPGPAVAEARETARRGYHKALQLNPHQFAVRVILAGMDAEEGNRAGAVRQLGRAVADEPNFIRGRLKLADMLEGLGRTGEAEEQRREAAQRRRLYPQPLPGWGGYERELLRPGAEK